MWLTGLVLLALTQLVSAEDLNLCEHEFCKCRRADHPQWLSVYCEFEHTQSLEFPMENSLELITDIDIHAAHEVTFLGYAFYYARNLRRITLHNCSNILFKPRSIVNIYSPNLRFEIIKADKVHFDKESFKPKPKMINSDSQSADGSVEPNFHQTAAGLSMYMERIREVVMDGPVFSNMQDLNMSVVQDLIMQEGSLQLDPKATVSHHGAELIIEWTDVSMKTLPKDTFASSAARITLKGVRIGAVAKDAFSATLINHLHMYNVHLGDVQRGAFKEGIFIETFELLECSVDFMESKAISAGINSFVVEGTFFRDIKARAIDVSAAMVDFDDNTIKTCANSSIRVNKFNNFTMTNNKLLHMEALAMELNPDQQPAVFRFLHNNLTSVPQLFVLPANDSSIEMEIRDNHYGLCHCNMSKMWLNSDEKRVNWCFSSFLSCNETADLSVKTVSIDRFLKTCVAGYVHENCSTIAIVPTKPPRAIDIALKNFDIFILPPVLTVLVVFFFVLFYFGTVGQSRYRVCCGRLKDTCRGLFLLPLCFHRSNCELESATSISQLPIPHDYTEMQCLNTSPRKENYTDRLNTNTPKETTTTIYVGLSNGEYAEVFTVDKATQSLPEELSKEFLESLKERLDDPDSYDDAKAIVDHLYELIKAEETCNGETRVDEENIYDLPIPPPERRVVCKKKERVSVGTDVPSLERLLPFSPYDRQNGLCHEYFEPKDLAVHVYAEISNYARSARGSIQGTIPDVLAGQAISQPRGPFLRAMQQKKKVEPTATIRSNGSSSSNYSAKMLNRPLPAQPSTFDPGEGTSSSYFMKT